jgi:hypothetical protein
MRKLLKSFHLLIDRIFGKYRYVVTYKGCNGNRYELFFKTWSEADECATNAFKSNKNDVTLKIK